MENINIEELNFVYNDEPLSCDKTLISSNKSIPFKKKSSSRKYTNKNNGKKQDKRTVNSQRNSDFNKDSSRELRPLESQTESKNYEDLAFKSTVLSCYNDSADVPDNLLLQMSPNYLDPNQINLILSTLNQQSNNLDASFDWGQETVLALPDPPTFTPSSRIFECTQCPYVTLNNDALTHHMDSPHPPLRPQITCLACSNIFYSVPPLKTHLLLDHEVVSEELQDIILLTLRRNNKYQNNTSSVRNEQNCLKDSYKTFGQGFESKRSDSCQPLASDSSCVSKSDNTLLKSRPTDITQDQETVSHEATPSNSRSLIKLPSLRRNFSYSPQSYPAGTFDEVCESEESDCSDSWDDKTTELGISEHLRLMEELKQTKMSGYRCGVDSCNFRFKSMNNWELHKSCHSKGGWKCPNCELSYSAWNSLCLHLWTSHSIDLELFYCNRCPFKTTSLSRLKNIHLLIHTNEKPFVCNTCKKGFKNGKQLRNHQVIHKEKNVKEGSIVKQECSDCKALFKNARQLKLHKNVVHSKKRPFKCDKCGHTASSRSSLVLHLRTHTGEKPYRCNECEYTCSDHNSFRRHSMRHSGLNLYTCPHCPYSSIQSSSFKAHVNSKHPGMLDDVVFSCPLCPFKTLRKDIFLGHASKHTTSKELPNDKEGDKT